MIESFIQNGLSEREIDRARRRNLVRDKVFLILLGPSATGKSTLIRSLNEKTSDKFTYVRPVTTRPLRQGETDKISVDDDEFDAMERRGEFVVVNPLYGVRYGTPIQGIVEPLSMGTTPILDYPLHRVDVLARPEYDMLKVYVYPPSIEEWLNRVRGSGRDSDGRVEAGIKELEMLEAQDFEHENIDISIVNQAGMVDSAAEELVRAIDSVVG